jgi:hypothetical protein
MSRPSPARFKAIPVGGRVPRRGRLLKRGTGSSKSLSLRQGVCRRCFFLRCGPGREPAGRNRWLLPTWMGSNSYYNKDHRVQRPRSRCPFKDRRTRARRRLQTHLGSGDRWPDRRSPCKRLIVRYKVRICWRRFRLPVQLAEICVQVCLFAMCDFASPVLRLPKYQLTSETRY